MNRWPKAQGGQRKGGDPHQRGFCNPGVVQRVRDGGVEAGLYGRGQCELGQTRCACDPAVPVTRSLPAFSERNARSLDAVT